MFGPPLLTLQITLITKIKISYFSNFILPQATNIVMVLATLNDHLHLYFNVSGSCRVEIANQTCG